MSYTHLLRFLSFIKTQIKKQLGLQKTYFYTAWDVKAVFCHSISPQGIFRLDGQVFPQSDNERSVVLSHKGVCHICFKAAIIHMGGNKRSFGYRTVHLIRVKNINIGS